MRFKPSLQTACVLALCATAAIAEPGLFSSSGLDGWSEQTFKDKKPTQYR